MDIKETKNLYAKERGYDSWSEFENKTPSFHISGHMTEVAQRHSQQYIDANKELSAWKKSMMKVHSELDLQKIGNSLDMLVGTPIAPNVLPKILELKQSNKELVEMLEEFTNAVETEEIIIKENYDNDGWENCGNRFYEKAKSLITKHKQ